MSKKHAITAIIYDKKGRPIAFGQNSYVRTHPLMAKMARLSGEPSRIYLHAEVAAIVRLKDSKRAYRMFVSRFTADGRPACAKPCLSCQRLISLTGIKHVEYT
jgi:deoxycytidylate deaminase